MTEQQPPKRRKSLGPVTNWTDADLNKMAEITDADIQAAVGLWETTAPKPVRKLLRARPKEQK